MKDKDLIQLIRERKDSDRKTFEEIQQELKKSGHVSDRTNKPLTVQTIKSKYYYGDQSNRSGSFAHKNNLGPRSGEDLSSSIKSKLMRVLDNKDLSGAQKLEMLRLLLEP